MAEDRPKRKKVLVYDEELPARRKTTTAPRPAPDALSRIEQRFCLKLDV